MIIKLTHGNGIRLLESQFIYRCVYLRGVVLCLDIEGSNTSISATLLEWNWHFTHFLKSNFEDPRLWEVRLDISNIVKNRDTEIKI